MPQIAQVAETFASQAFWLLVFFGLVFLVVGRGMLPRILSVREQREQTVAADLAAAQAARDQADADEAAWRARENANRAEAAQLIAAAKADAARQSAETLAAAQSDMDARVLEAEARIAAARNAGLAEVEAVAAEATSAMVARLAGLQVAPEQARGAVARVLSHV